MLEVKLTAKTDEQREALLKLVHLAKLYQITVEYKEDETNTVVKVEGLILGSDFGI